MQIAAGGLHFKARRAAACDRRRGLVAVGASAVSVVGRRESGTVAERLLITRGTDTVALLLRSCERCRRTLCGAVIGVVRAVTRPSDVYLFRDDLEFVIRRREGIVGCRPRARKESAYSSRRYFAVRRSRYYYEKLSRYGYLPTHPMHRTRYLRCYRWSPTIRAKSKC